FQSSRENRLSRKDLEEKYNREISDIKTLMQAAKTSPMPDFDAIDRYQKELQNAVQRRRNDLRRYDKAIEKGEIPDADTFFEAEVIPLDFSDEEAVFTYEQIRDEKFDGLDYDELHEDDREEFEKLLKQAGYSVPPDMKKAAEKYSSKKDD